jgi:hypothetical protein
MQQDNQQQKEAASSGEANTPANGKSEHVMVQNPNPRANENIRDTPMEDNAAQTANDVGSEITDGEAG